jgi:hypothetical protein
LGALVVTDSVTAAAVVAPSLAAADTIALAIHAGNAGGPGQSGANLSLLGGASSYSYSDGGSVLITSSSGSTAYGNADGHITLTANGNGTTGGAYVSIAPSGVETVRFISGGAWSVGTAGNATGTVGQVLTSAGPTGSPTWVSLNQFGNSNVSIGTDSITSLGSVITIDPTTAGAGGTVIIAGNLQVTGTTTTIDSVSVTTADLNVNLAKNAVNAAAADGAGLTIGTYGSNPSLLYGSTADNFVFNRAIVATSFTGPVTGNASTATALQTARNINGVSFDGTADITITATGGISAADNNTYTKAQRGAVVALTPSATITPDFAASNNFSLTAGQSFTLAFPTNVVAGQSGIIVITQDATGSRVITWGSGWVAAGGSKPVLTTTANAVDYISYYVETTGRIFVSSIADVK